MERLTLLHPARPFTELLLHSFDLQEVSIGKIIQQHRHVGVLSLLRIHQLHRPRMWLSMALRFFFH